MYIINCPVMADEYRYNDGRYEMAWERERELLDNSDIAEALYDSACPAEIADAYVALADANRVLYLLIENHGKGMSPSDLAILRELAAIAQCASTEVEKVADKIVCERLEAGE